jgi:AmmeMemoRadiSam system protein B
MRGAGLTWYAGRIVDGVREPVVAGIYYESEPERLKAQLEMLFSQAEGSAGGCTIKGLLVPHAGYIYSGDVAAKAYSLLKARRKPELIVILAPNHTGLGAAISVFPGRAFRTPLGDVKVDNEASRLLAESIRGARLEPYAHLYEHSVEVQLPMLQHVYGADGVPPIVAIVSSEASIEAAERTASALEAISRERDVLVIATSNMTQFKPLEEVKRLDNTLIEAIVSLDPQKIMAAVEAGANPCGLPVILTLASYARRIGGRIELLSYKTSSDVGGSRSLTVGYAALRVC